MKNNKIITAFLASIFLTNINAANLVNPPNIPLDIGAASSVKPNIIFILDDSGSMGFDYLGDETGNSSTGARNCKSINSNGSVNPFGRICASNNSGTSVTGGTNAPTGINNPSGNFAGDTLFFAYKFNKIYYNPSVTYTPGVNAQGESLPNQTITNAQIDPYRSPGSRRNLLTSLQETYFCTIQNPNARQREDKSICRRNGLDTPNPFNYLNEGLPNSTFRFPLRGPTTPHYYNMIAKEFCDESGSVCSNNPASGTPIYVRWCLRSQDATSSTIPTGKFTSGSNNGRNICQATYVKGQYIFPRFGDLERVEVKTSEYQNFANWYSYYRNRMLTMKTSAGKSFSLLENDKRVGFKTINFNTSRFLPIRDFDSTQKQAFFNMMYSIEPSGGTPLRESLSRAGRYFAGKTDGINSGMINTTNRLDPMQFSCQKNFALLSTDGYWNGNQGRDLSNAIIGNVDNIDAGFSKRSDGVFDGNLSGSSGSLADVALYYYQTDLRPSGAKGANGVDVSENNVPLSVTNNNTQQHMITYTLALGLDGFMKYTKDYNKGGNPDFENIKLGVSGACSWTSGVCNWPVPVEDTASSVDDIWHAAVNGRGVYFSAKYSEEIAESLTSALNDLIAKTGAGAAAATSSPNITSVDNFLYYTTYRTFKWDGEIAKREIDPVTGKISTNNLWSAANLLNGRVSDSNDSRNIFFLRKNNTNTNLINFNYANLNSTEREYFDDKCEDGELSQCNFLNSFEKSIIDDGENIVKYLRGQRLYEKNIVTSEPILRERDFVLSDIVNSSPVFVSSPNKNWLDDGYSKFKEDNKNRQKTLYVGSNGGKLHAFNADTGQEMWAIIPSQIMNKMYRLADKNYNVNHEFFVNGEISVMDAKIGSNWGTVLVASMGHGSRGYFALDVTNPNNPKPLWELCLNGSICSRTDADLGLSFGNPIITKRHFDNKWVVYVSSGFDNINGKGLVYELDLATGQILRKLNANLSSTTTNQIGISKINAYYDDFNKNNLAKSIYAGDLRGNIWYFDLTNPTATNALLIGTAIDENNIPQPITTKIELGTINGYEVLFFGTGKYLNFADFNTDEINSIYAIKNNKVNNGILRNNPGIIKQDLTDITKISSQITNNSVNWDSDLGWFFDLKSEPGEKITIEPKLVLGTLSIISNVPQTTACEAGGTSWFYQVDFRSGTTFKSSDFAATKLPYGLVVGRVIAQLGNSGSIKNFITNASGDVVTLGLTIDNQNVNFNKHNWKEIYNEK